MYQNLLFGAGAGRGRSQNFMGGAGTDIFLPGAGAEQKIWSLSRGKMARFHHTLPGFTLPEILNNLFF